VIKRDILENRVKTSYLSIGSNLGNKFKNIDRAKFNLSFKDTKIVDCSSYYESLSWPNPKNPKFINIIVKIETTLSPIKLLNKCNLIEKKLGRKRSKKNAPRICDIDIIDYDQKTLNFDGKVKLLIPHPLLKERNFVLLPLYEICKDWKHPSNGKNISSLIKSLNSKDLMAIKQI